MARRGRKNLYETHVRPRLDEIEQWLSQGMTEKDVCKNLGISYDSFYRYKREQSELYNVIKKGRIKPVKEIKNALYKRAIGFQYTEKKEITDSEGYTRVETHTKTALPDPTAALMLLKHWDKEGGWTSDPQTLELKKKELELREKRLEKEDW